MRALILDDQTGYAPRTKEALLLLADLSIDDR